MADGGGEPPRALKASASWARRQTDVTNSECSISTNPPAQRRTRPSSAPLLGFGNGIPVPREPSDRSDCDLSRLTSTSSLGKRGYHRCCTDITLLDGVSPYLCYTKFDSSAETANRTLQRQKAINRSLNRSLCVNLHDEAEDSTLYAQHLDSTSVGMLLGGSCCAGVVQRHRRERSLLGDMKLDLSRTETSQDFIEHGSETASTPSNISATMKALDAPRTNAIENRSRPGCNSGDGGNDARPASRPSTAGHLRRPSTAGPLRQPASAASVQSNSSNGTPKAAAARAGATAPQRPISAARTTVTGLPQRTQVSSMAGNSGINSATASVPLRPDVGMKGLLRRGGGRREGSWLADCEQRKADQRRPSGGATRSRAQARQTRRERPRGMTHCSSAPCLSVL